MKFGKYLKQNIEPSIGVSNYLDYETLKIIIKNLTQKVRRARALCLGSECAGENAPGGRNADLLVQPIMFLYSGSKNA